MTTKTTTAAPAKCQWFALCDRPATTTAAHPIIGQVPICARCAAKLARLRGPDFEEIARGNVEANLSDAVVEDGADAIHDSAYVLAFDAVIDAGGSLAEARRIAGDLAQSFAAP
jgi:hypothetical protein